MEEDLKKILKDPKYVEAKQRIEKWLASIEQGNKETVIKIRDEKRNYFDNLKKTAPRIYQCFEINDKILSEMIIKKLIGRDIIID